MNALPGADDIPVDRPPPVAARRPGAWLLASLALHAVVLSLPPVHTGGTTAPAALRVALRSQALPVPAMPAALTPVRPVRNDSAPATPADATPDAAQPSRFAEDNTPAPAIDVDGVPAAMPSGETVAATPASVAVTPQPQEDPLAGLCAARKPPGYPPLARRLGETGDVTVALHIAADGIISEAWIVESSGSTRLDRAALAAIGGWRCRAPERDGVPTDLVARQHFSFRLE